MNESRFLIISFYCLFLPICLCLVVLKSERNSELKLKDSLLELFPLEYRVFEIPPQQITQRVLEASLKRKQEQEARLKTLYYLSLMVIH